MASHRLFFFSLLILSQLLFITYPIQSTASRVSSKKVSLSLYYETLCPYCSRFMVNHLPKIFDKGLVDIIDLNLVPYGNAKLGSNKTITCQHGPYECLLNTVEACAIHVWPDLNKHYSFIYCVERLVAEGKYSRWESCFAKLNFDSKPIEDCYNGGYGKKLDLQYAAETNALQPPHTYVPWVVVDGLPLYDDYENFVTYVCKAYKGSSVPEACRELPLEIMERTKSNQALQASYADDTSSSSSSTTTTKILSRLNKKKLRRHMQMASSV